MGCTLAIDQGTHASRAILFDDAGNEIAKSVVEVKLHRLDAARVEQSAEQLLQSVNTAVADVLAQGAGRKITACGLATQRSTVLGWQADGDAITPALSWQDVRAAAALEALKPQAEDIQRISGLPLSAHYGASKIQWLAARTEYKQADRISPLVSYLLYHLLAEKPYLVDHCNAQRTQLFDLEKLNWSESLCKLFAVERRLLPDCKPICHRYGVLKAAAIPLTAVSGDQNAAFYAAGSPAPDVALVNLGTGAFALRALTHYCSSQKQLSGVALSSAETITWLREATVNGAGSALAWVAEKYQITDSREALPRWLDEVAAPPLFINSVGGLGSPWWNAQITPHFLEENLTPAQRMCAVVESILFMLQANLELMHNESRLQGLRVSGGLSNLDALCQKLANLSGLPVERGMAPEATARGIAWLAAGQPRHWDTRKQSTLFTPLHDAGIQSRYHAAMESLQALLIAQDNTL
ncbi:MAG: FGGY family carbohydrate kinase [Gammaproteobacteria bacterium]